MKELARLRGGNVVLFKPDDRKYIQARMKINGEWPWWSTKHTDVEEAKFAALTRYDEQFNSPSPKKRRNFFGDFCKEYSTNVLATNIKPVYKSYRSTLETWIEPFFGQMPIKAIDDDTIDSYYQHLQKKLGRVPAKGTINTNNVVLRAIFDIAVKRKIITRGEMPSLTIKNKGRKAKRRPHFEVPEIELMMAKLVEWQHASDRFMTRYKRHLLMRYVAFLLETGCRPGEELNTLTWDCIDETISPEGKNCVRVWVLKGKHGNRKPIANDHARHTLGHLLNYKETQELYPTDRSWVWTPERAKPYHGERIFAGPYGDPITGLSEMFRNFLIEYGLYEDKNQDKRALYSCRHSFITIALIHRTLTVQEIAAQCGTSIEMISRHYSHVIPEMAADRLSSGIAHHLPYKL